MASNPDPVIRGFREDCSRLITRFEQLETVRYDGFCEIWRDMKFSLVFAGRKFYVEILEFCEDSLTIAKEFFLPPLSFNERIGGLYLLYGLYFKMPITGPKIRVKLTEWQDIIEFRAELGQAEHHDASFILSKLMSSNAFLHTFLDQELGLEKNYRMKPGRRVNPYSLLPEIRELAAPNDLFDRINELSKEYASAKSSNVSRPSTSSTSDNSHSGLRLYDSNFGEKLLDSVKQLENSRRISKNAAPHNPRIKAETKLGARIPCLPEAKSEETRKGNKSFGAAIRTITGHGFDTDSASSEEEEAQDDDGNPTAMSMANGGSLPDYFDSGSSASE